MCLPRIWYVFCLLKVKNNITENQTKPNAEFLYDFLTEKLTMAFSNTSHNLIVEKINNWFQKTDEKLFKEEVEDFLVLINRYSPQEIVENKTQNQKAVTTGAWFEIIREFTKSWNGFIDKW